MPEDDGLPLPPTRPLRPASVPREPDLAPGTVQNSLESTLRTSAETTGRWGNALATKARVPGDPTFIPFGGSGGSALQPVESLFEHTAGDASLGGFLKGWLDAIETGTQHPVTAITDQVMVAKIRELQEKFLKDHADTLLELSRDLGRAKNQMQQLADILKQTNFDASKVFDIMGEKARLGNHEFFQIRGALNRASTPEDRQKLQTLQDDLSRWMEERDARLQGEMPEIKSLGSLVGRVSAQVSKQADAMWAASGSSPSNIDHSMPAAIRHVISLHDFLLGSRIALSQKLSGTR